MWYSIDDAWKEWCIGSDFGLENLAVSYEMEIDLSLVLVISDGGRLKDFQKKYQYLKYPTINHYEINWQTVAKDYKGIEINPYLYEYRFIGQMLWYNGWDCSSGCIWDKSAILGFNELNGVNVIP